MIGQSGAWGVTMRKKICEHPYKFHRVSYGDWPKAFRECQTHCERNAECVGFAFSDASIPVSGYESQCYVCLRIAGSLRTQTNPDFNFHERAGIN